MKIFSTEENYLKYRNDVSKRFSFWTNGHFSNEIAMGLSEVRIKNGKQDRLSMRFLVNPFNENDLCKSIRISKNAKRKCGKCHKENAISCINMKEPINYQCYLGLCNIAIPIAEYNDRFLCVLGGQMIPNTHSIKKVRQLLNDVDQRLYSLPIDLKNGKLAPKKIELLRDKARQVFKNINNLEYLKEGLKGRLFYRDPEKLKSFIDKLEEAKDIYDFSNLIIEQSCSLIGASRSSIFLKIPNTNLIICTGSNVLKNYKDECLWYRPGEGATGYVFDKGIYVVVNDLKNYRGYSDRYPGFHWKRKHGEDISPLTKQRQFMGIPILIGNEIIGVIRFPGLITGGELKEIHAHIISNFIKKISEKIFEKQNKYLFLNTNNLSDLFSTLVVKNLTDQTNTQTNRNLETIGLHFSNSVNLETLILVATRNNHLKYKVLHQSDKIHNLIVNKNDVIRRLKTGYFPLIQEVNYSSIFDTHSSPEEPTKSCLVWPLYAKRKLIGCFITCAPHQRTEFLRYLIHLTQSIAAKFVSKIDNRQNDILRDFINEHLFRPMPTVDLKSLADYICRYYRISNQRYIDILLYENNDNNFSLIHHWGGGHFKKSKFLNSYLLPLNMTTNKYVTKPSPFKTGKSNRIEQYSAYAETFICGNGKDQRVGGIKDLESSIFISIPIKLPTEKQSLLMTVWFHSPIFTFDFSENFLLLVVHLFALLHYENIKPLKKLERVSLRHILKGGGPLQWLAGLPAHEFKNLINITLNKVSHLSRALTEMGPVIRPATLKAALKAESNLEQIYNFYLRYLELIKNIDGNLESSQSYSAVQLLDEIADLVQYEKNVNINVYGDIREIIVQVNKSLFTLVIVSLIKNSIDAYNSRDIRNKDIVISIKELNNSNELEIIVTDYAGGFDVKDTLKYSQKTGAGLILCEYAVTFMGGRFNVESVNNSTIAHIYLRREMDA